MEAEPGSSFGRRTKTRVVEAIKSDIYRLKDRQIEKMTIYILIAIFLTDMVI